MKCQNCGKSDVNFHYKSNVNGTVTEANLCTECAEKAGYNVRDMFNNGGVFGGRGMFGYPVFQGFAGRPGVGSVFDAVNEFDSFFPMFSARGGFGSMVMPMLGFSPFFRAALQPMAGANEAGTQAECACSGDSACECEAPVKDEARTDSAGETQDTSVTHDADNNPHSRGAAHNQEAAPAQDTAQTRETSQGRGKTQGMWTGIDGEMRKRREINVLREQMRRAARREDFEKAAELRDQIRGIQ